MPRDPSQLGPLVSVLTPVYNGQKYLADCINSVRSQTYQNWEYAIVNNRSTDRTLEVAQQYAELDPRIRVYTNHDFVNMGENHNIAFRTISPVSKYCKVLHADDWLFPNCISEMVTVAEEHPSVGVVGAYGLNGVRVTWDGLPYPSTVTRGKEICRKVLLGGLYVFGSPTSHLIRSDLIRSRDPFYNTNEFHLAWMDQEACYDVLQSSDFGFVHQVLTYTRQHEESATASITRGGLSTDFPSQLNLLKQYGPVYLEVEEYEKHLSEFVGQYYRFLGQCVFFRRRDKRFWNYHKSALNHVGLPLSRIRLIRASFSEIVDTLLNPLRMAGKVLGIVSKSKPLTS
jgi:glycosyltransferase involved in cell wall biosynthesis